ncbi:hypothetical protein ACFXOS_14110 [Streptomyces sp. NPDC059175]|uniref:hypothetical protein n=1 Tax=Streptomyces sp. NPDC059175 TaxID=3346757 RepID=UPI0036819720
MTAARRGTTIQLLEIGRRAARGRRDPRHALQALCLVLAATGAALLVWGVLATHAAYEGRDARTAARQPDRALAHPGLPPVARWWNGGDSLRNRGFSVVTIEPLVPSATPPPGLARWPGPGEAFVSPALLDAMPQASTRYGRLAGTIAARGLAETDEYLVYRRPPDGTSPPAGPDGFADIVGYGRTAEGTSDFRSQSFDRAEADLHWLMAPFLGLPVLVLLVVASRLGARQRDRRLAVLYAIGAGRSVRARIALGECLRPLALGTALAGAPLAVTTLTGLTLPLTGYRIRADDLAPLRQQFPVALVLGWALLCLVFASLHLRVRPAEGNRLRPLRDVPPAWPRYLCGVGTLLTLWGAMIGNLLGVRLFTLGLVLALAGLPALLGRIAAGAAVRFTDRRRGDAARLVGGRWAAAHPGVLARSCAALAVLMGLLTQVHVAITELTTDAQHATALARQLNGRLLHVTAGAADQEANAGFLAALAPGDRVLRISSDESGTRPVVLGECRDLAALAPLSSCPRTEPVPAAQAFRGRTPGTEALRWMSFGEVLVQALPSRDGLPAGDGDYVVLVSGRDGPDRITRAAFEALPLPSVAVPGDDHVIGASARARIADWVSLLAAPGLVLLALAGAIGLLHAYLDRADALRPLAGYTSGLRFHLRAAWWGIGLPTACALALATAFAGLLGGINLAFLSPSGASPLPLLGGGLAVAAVLCAGLTTVGGLLSSRFTHRWVPRGD